MSFLVKALAAIVGLHIRRRSLTIIEQTDVFAPFAVLPVLVTRAGKVNTLRSCEWVNRFS
jgi:hypothetical protein